MSSHEAYYDINPITVIDQNVWDIRTAELAMKFRNSVLFYTPLVEWTNITQSNNAANVWQTEMLEGDVDVDDIPMLANYVGMSIGVDSRQRKLAIKRYADKVQMHKSSNMFQQWKISGGSDWRPLLRGLLGSNIIRKHEILARNSFFLTPKEFWTISGNTSFGNGFADIGSADTLKLEQFNEWNLRMGNIGDPIIPGDSARAKLALIPPGASYDILQSLAAASSSEASMFRDAHLYAGVAIPGEIGSFKNIRMQRVDNNNYGENLSILYNSGPITVQYGVAERIQMGDGAPDPEVAGNEVDGVWLTGQKDVTHYIKLQSDADMTQFAVQDIVTIHTARTDYFGITSGVDFRSGKTIQRRVIAIDSTNKTLSFDRPILFNYTSLFPGTPFGTDGTTGATAGQYYAYVTKGRHIGMTLVLGSRGGIQGDVAKPIEFYEPRPVDDFDSVWRFVWDEYVGYNLRDPYLHELHFHAVTLPKVGGKIGP